MGRRKRRWTRCETKMPPNEAQQIESYNTGLKTFNHQQRDETDAEQKASQNFVG